MNIKDLFTKSKGAALFNAALTTSFYQEILNFLHDENDNEKLGDYYARQNTAKEDSYAELIYNTADLSQKANNSILELTDFWNESVQNSINYFNNKIVNWDTTWWKPWTKDDIVYANAAIDFSSDYVKPQKNIDEDYYTNASHPDVRGDDVFTYALNNSANLQFTHTRPNEDGTFPPFAKWLRLIMPMNTRRVEVEDLDRNFWVIGQALSIISKYLFEDKSPLHEMLWNLLREIVELWENALYLWTDYAAATGRTQEVKLILDLPNNVLCPYRKFDGFDSTPALLYNDNPGWQRRNEDILNNYFAYLPKKYPKSRISLWVRQRHNNYYNNYFHTDIYPYYGYYDGSKWKWFLVLHTVNNRTDVIKTTAISEGLDNEVYGFNTNREYGAYKDHESQYPITALRVEVKIRKGGLMPSLEYEVYDAVKQMIFVDVEPLRKYYSRIEGGAIIMESYSHEEETPGPSGTINTIYQPIYPGEISTNNYEEWM